MAQSHHIALPVPTAWQAAIYVLWTAPVSSLTGCMQGSGCLHDQGEAAGCGCLHDQGEAAGCGLQLSFPCSGLHSMI